jgi:lysophospholipase L1-like esterase
MADPVAWVLARGLTPVVVTPPYISRRHERQQASLAAGLAGRFGARVGYINMGKTIDLRDHALSPDGVHLTPRGNQTLAEILAVRVHEVVGPR